MSAVSDFEEAIGTLRSVFERLALLWGPWTARPGSRRPAEEGRLDAIRPEGRGRPEGAARN
jgi:hypothetical protein